jgi:hypothetical protein
MLSVLGPPGTGKSWLIRSATEVGKLAVALAPAAELDGYAGWDVDYELFEDLLWKPHLNKYEANAFNRLLKWIEKQAASPDVKSIGVDSMSVVSDLIMHEALKVHSTDNPMELEYGRAFYAHNGMMKQLLQALQQTRSAGKHVICSWHVTMKEQEGAGTPVKLVDRKTKEEKWKFEENMLPTMHGSMRQDVGKWFSLWLYTDMSGFGPGTKYYVSAVPNKARPAKKRIEFREGVNPARLANDFKTIVEAIK